MFAKSLSFSILYRKNVNTTVKCSTVFIIGIHVNQLLQVDCLGQPGPAAKANQPAKVSDEKPRYFFA